MQEETMRDDLEHSYDRIAGSPSRQRELEGLVGEVARHNITRRQFLERAAVLGLGASGIATILAACGGGEAESSSSPVAIDTTVKPKEIYFYNWADYLAPSNKTKFEKETGIKVVESYFDNLDAVITKMKAGVSDYDLIPPAGWALPILYKSDLLQPLQMDLVPNIKNAMAKFQNPNFDDPAENDGKKYSVPYQWGSVGIAYRTDKVDPAPTSWTTLFSPAADPYKGKLTMLDDSRETPGATLKMLGYSLNTTDEAELNEAIDKLIEQKPLVAQYDNSNCKRNLVTGMPLVHTWDGTTRQAMREAGEDSVAYVLPTEGYSVWVDNLAIPKNARSAYGAHLFMDFMLEPENQAELIDYTQYLSPVPEAFDVLGDEILSSGIPTEEEMSRGEFLLDLGEFTRKYTDGWRQVKSS
jgi:spermidine/putrescine transport system substrate-binding protein